MGENPAQESTFGEYVAKLHHFAEVLAPPSSPLYAHMAARLLRDPEVLAISAEEPPSQPAPLLLFAAVRFLLRREGRDIAANMPPDEAYGLLRAVVLEQAGEVRRLLATRMVQTNEVRRSAFIYPAYLRIVREFPARPVALIEIGPSAGLNLLFDRYRYRLPDGALYGDLDSPLELAVALRGERRPSFEPSNNEIVARIGMDLNCIDLHDPDEIEWLRSLIWPEHTERQGALDQALLLRQKASIEMVEGDAIEGLDSVLDRIAADIVPIVFHTYVANQLSAAARAALLDRIDGQGQRRDLAHLHNCIEPHLHATVYREGQRQDLPLARTEAHARWIEWLDPQT